MLLKIRRSGLCGTVSTKRWKRTICKRKKKSVNENVELEEIRMRTVGMLGRHALENE